MIDNGYVILEKIILNRQLRSPIWYVKWGGFLIAKVLESR